MPDISILKSIAEVSRDEWDACCPGGIETHDYLRAVETAGLAGFDWRYAVAREHGALIAVAPAFLTIYSLDTTLTGATRQIAQQVASVAPGALKLRLACLGSPCTENAAISFHPQLPQERRSAVFQELLSGFERAAAEAACGLVAIKDFAIGQGWRAEEVLRAKRYGAVASMPTARLDIDFDDVQQYLNRFSASTRKDMRRKLKAQDHVTIETRRDLKGWEQQVLALYRDTLERAELKFEELTMAYFCDVLSNMGDRARCILYLVEGELLAANLLVQNKTTLLDKFFVMDAERGRAHNLYFLSWFNNINLCLDEGLRCYVAGQAGYANKLRLGCVLDPTRTYFRHRNAVMNSVLRFAAPMLSGALSSEVRV